MSLAFTPDTAPDCRRTIDEYLCAAMGLPGSFVDELVFFTETVQGARLFGRPTQDCPKELAA